jgi:hypothetical protein
MKNDITFCSFCGMKAPVNMHHIVPKSLGGKTTAPTCTVCEGYIHANWTHKELRDTFNTIESIVENEGFKKFLTWRRKQPASTLFKSSPGKYRDKNPYH